MADCSQLQAVPTSPTLPAKYPEGTALNIRTLDAKVADCERGDIERRIFAIASVCARLDEYDSQAKALKSSYPGLLVRAQITSLKTNLLDLMRELLVLRKDNDLTMKSILQQYNINHNIKKKTEETDVEYFSRPVSDMQATFAELRSMKGPVSIFIGVLVEFYNLVNKIDEIEREGSDGAPGDTSIPSRRPDMAPLSVMLGLQTHILKILDQSATGTEASSGVALGDATTAAAEVDESPFEPESWISIGGDSY